MINLIADIGGTNIRIARLSQANTDFSAIRTYAVADFEKFEGAIAQYQSDEGIAQLDHVCIAIACPVNGDVVSMTNHSWSFSITDVQQKLNLKSFLVINDFTAQAMALPFLSNENKIQVGGEQADTTKPMVVYGPGTGLGVAHLVNTGKGYMPLPGEGGHVTFAPIGELEQQINQVLADLYAHVSVERLVSGPGLYAIYQAICKIKKVDAIYHTPASVCQAALEGNDEYSKLALNTFCEVMGSLGGNLALNIGAYGGVFIAGGIVPRFIEFLKASDFRKRFEEKGRFKDYLSPIPVYVVTEEQPGLLGAAAYLAQNIEV
ncbi:glucokinase [Catenovulum sp. SM1970]|uniref:glucokinase n=1 Tax=Marinifaba aquimaris TaxID=2741323 RepID=UPI001571A018|nr:glucokinase [Marinifaba aquimaris]NTS76972.1 glucokinase [Marinifaba aquimaris]